MIRLILLSAIFLAGCAISPNVYKNTMSGQFTRMPRTPPIDANVGLEVRHSLAPAMRAFWKAWLNGDQQIANYEQAVRLGSSNARANPKWMSGSVASSLSAFWNSSAASA